MTPEMIHAFQRDRKLVLTEKAVRFKAVRRLTIEASPHTIDSQERAIEFLSDLFEQRPTEALYAIAINSILDCLTTMGGIKNEKLYRGSVRSCRICFSCYSIQWP